MKLVREKLSTTHYAMLPSCEVSLGRRSRITSKLGTLKCIGRLKHSILLLVNCAQGGRNSLVPSLAQGLRVQTLLNTARVSFGENGVMRSVPIGGQVR